MTFSMKCLIFIIVVIYLHIKYVDAQCGVLLQSRNIRYLNSSQLTLYNLTSPCITTCSDGFYGDFCQDLSQYSRLPLGPWNQAGYCTAGAGIMRSMSIDVSGFDSVQYTGKDSVLIGIRNPGFTTAIVSEIFLYSRTIVNVLYPTPAGTLNALLVRRGKAYVARSVKVDGLDTYDIALLTSPMQARRLIGIPSKASYLEVCEDKGTTTYFVYGFDTVHACYPNGVCRQWLGSVSTITGIISGADCRTTLYASNQNNLLRITEHGVSLILSTGVTYCLTGLPAINVLLYKTKDDLWQLNLGTGATSRLPLGVVQTQQVVCSVDVSEQSSQILIVQNGVVSTLEAVQSPCPYGTTSQPLLCNSTAQCAPCPPPPTNAFFVEGSVVCAWDCLPGYTRLGSRCVAPVPLPCPEYYRTAGDGRCIPSVLPWAGPGRMVASLFYSSQRQFPTPNLPFYTVASLGGDTMVHAVPGRLFLSTDGVAWAELSFDPYSAVRCGFSDQNSYYYLSARPPMLWAAFTMQLTAGTQHCLWMVNATGAASTLRLRVVQHWALDSALCSATDEDDRVYALLCGHNYVISGPAHRASALEPTIGAPINGYADGPLLAARFDGPTSLAAHDARLYIADSGNCLLREADLVRGLVSTVAGSRGDCQRVDGVGEASRLSRPFGLINTPYDGFLIFLDRFGDGHGALSAVRQFHAPSLTVTTISLSPFAFLPATGLAAGGQGVFVISQRFYYVYVASWQACPPGTSSLEGNAFDSSDCYTCPAQHFSDATSCRPCATLQCDKPGELLIPCQPGADARCGQCSNAPNGSRYTSASSVPGVPGDCGWAYTPPCPPGYYEGANGLCVGCPSWSTTPGVGSRSLADCTCLGGGQWAGGACVIASPYSATPSVCHPLAACPPYVRPAFPFPLLGSCSSFDVDSRAGVCPCQPGEHIQQIYPKVCAACPPGLYSPSGVDCLVCPYLTEPTRDQTACRCSAGTVDVALAQAEPRCECGPGRAFFQDSGCTPCPANTFSVERRVLTSFGGHSMRCMQCSAGKWSPAGASECMPCPVGQYRSPGDNACMSCPAGQYAPAPDRAVCVPCEEGCGGRREALCPGGGSDFFRAARFMCSDCPPPRAHAWFNGERDCATECDTGYYEREGECVRCSEYYKGSCGPGNRFVPCSRYADAVCVGCVNASMPLNFAVWSYRSDAPDGPSTACEWECQAGYAASRPPLPDAVEAMWECVRSGAWSVWDLFSW